MVTTTRMRKRIERVDECVRKEKRSDLPSIWGVSVGFQSLDLSFLFKFVN